MLHQIRCYTCFTTVGDKIRDNGKIFICIQSDRSNKHFWIKEWDVRGAWKNFQLRGNHSIYLIFDDQSGSGSRNKNFKFEVPYLLVRHKKRKHSIGDQLVSISVYNQ